MRGYKSITVGNSPIAMSLFGVAVSLFLAGCSPTTDDCDRNNEDDCDRSGGSYVPYHNHTTSGNSTKPKVVSFPSTTQVPIQVTAVVVTAAEVKITHID